MALRKNALLVTQGLLGFFLLLGVVFEAIIFLIPAFFGFIFFTF